MSRASSLLIIAHDSVLQSPVEARNIARAIGKPYSTLMRELNVYDTGAKLGADTLLQIMQATRDIKPLEFMAGELGYKVVPQ